MNDIRETLLVEINFLINELCTNRIDCIYIDLPLFDEVSSHVIARLRESGFFFGGGILPEFRNDDIIRMQYLNNFEFVKDDIKTASDHGVKVLNYVIEDMEQVEFLGLLSTST